MIIDADTLDATASYKLLIGSILPRAIGWVSTLSVDGVANLAPISFFTAVGRKPPMVSLSLQPRMDGVTLKDTFVNMRDTGEFVTNLVTLPQAFAMHRTAKEWEPHEDEFAEVGLDKEQCEVVKSPRVKDAPIALECVVHRIFPVGDMHDHVVWGRVVRFHIRDDLYVGNNRIDTGALTAVGRLAAEYTITESAFVPPLDVAVLKDYQDFRMRRLDQQDLGWSPLDTATWSPSGSTKD